ncbi:NAD(P)-dependent oxidoreductase [Brachybacterium sp. AOP43-C2-M15]|uniref:NAD(P)-dependent oxidoreductase n=1 Tax=Brachybacterium sp. AOP43-C2-M15 TaxID=3457661 RepID=UPI0040342329
MTAAPSVAWIGLGAIGTPMARTAAAAGLPVTAFDLNPAAREAVADVAAPAATARDAVRHAQIVVVMVATPAQLESVLFGEAGIAADLAASSTLLIMSTVGPAAIEDAVARLAGRWPDGAGPDGAGPDGAGSDGAGRDGTAVRVVDAPVSGGAARAADGDLLIMVGGAEEDVATVRPLLDALAANAPVVGPAPGDGQRFKIVNQLLCGVHIAAAGEALALADRMGLDLAQVHEVLGTGAAASFMFGDRGQRMVDGAFDDVRSALTIFVKDMGLVTEAAAEASQEVPLAAAAQELYRRGSELGWDRRDDSIVYEVLRSHPD